MTNKNNCSEKKEDYSRPTAIIFLSRTGHTRRYAEILGGKIGLPVFSYGEGIDAIPSGSRIIYMGWIHASSIKGYREAAKRYSISAVCGVGLCDTGQLIPEVRKATSISAEIPLFTLQGGFDRSRLKGLDKLLISMLTKGLSSQKNLTERDGRMLELLSRDGDYVREENLSQFLSWYISSFNNYQL